jgi:TldD protein
VPGASGSFFFDDEGQLATPTAIIRDGIFLQGIGDRYSAERLGLPRTANGRRESFASKAYARMTNTYFGTGQTPFETMLAGVERGVYLRRGHSGMEDPQGWGMQLIIHYGEEIRDGKLTGRLFSPIGVTGYVPDVLQSITLVGDIAHINNSGMCGKGHKEWIPVSDGGPHLRLRARLG